MNKFQDRGFGLEPFPRPRYNPKRTIGHKNKERREKGELFNEKRKWTDDQIDILLNNYFLPGGWRDARVLLGRSERSIITFLEHKICTKYPSCARYIPTNRINREGKTWASKDYDIMRRSCLGRGFERAAFEPGWLSRLLQRSELSIYNEYRRLEIWGLLGSFYSAVHTIEFGPIAIKAADKAAAVLEVVRRKTQILEGWAI